MANILDGKKIANQRILSLIKTINDFRSKKIIPQLAIVRVGNDLQTITYIKHKKKLCQKLQIKCLEVVLETAATTKKILTKIAWLNQNKNIHGIIVQLPLPKHVNTNKVINEVAVSKDIDGLNSTNFAKLVNRQDTLVSSTALGIMDLLKEYQIKLANKNVVIIGRSKIVGLPLLHLFIQNDATVTLCFLKTKNLTSYTKIADIIVVAAGVPHLIKSNMVKKGVVLIDVGISKINQKIVGDVDFKNLQAKASWITPNPGGVGPMTIVSIIQNLLKIVKNSLV